ncbi:MAG TPA: hypothetical protein VN278_01800 [Methanosarcina sp.]|nr:hypothetical protein [Methanosarcina sp.]
MIENDYVDLVAIGRGMLADPEFANHVIPSEPVNTCWDVRVASGLLRIHFARQEVMSET